MRNEKEINETPVGKETERWTLLLGETAWREFLGNSLLTCLVAAQRLLGKF